MFVLLSLNITGALQKQKQESLHIPVNDIPEKERAYKDGECLIYKIYYEWGMIKSDVGEAKATLIRQKDTLYGDHFHSIVTGRTYKFYDLFFKIRDFFESKFNTINGRPYYFHREIAEGRYRMKNTYYFNKDYSIQANVQRKSDPVIDTLLKAKKHTFDIVSLFYFVRNFDFSQTPIGVNQPISFAIDNEVFDLYYRFEGKETIRVPGKGYFNTLKFAARVVSGEVFSGDQELVLWVSDDKNKIPLYFETPIKVGRVIGRINNFENLKFPLTSKIK